MKRTFNDFMQEVHYKLFPTVLDDDLSDHFDNWLGEKQVDDLIEWAEIYGEEQYLAGKEEILTTDNLK